MYNTHSYIKPAKVITFCIFLCSFIGTLQANNQVEKEIQALHIEATRLAQVENDNSTADSLSIEAIHIAEASLETDILFKALMNYFKRDTYGSGHAKPEGIIEKAIVLEDELSKKLDRFELWIELVDVLIKSGDLKRAHTYGQKALSHAASTTDYKKKVRAYIAMSKCARENKQIKEAWGNILNANTFLAKIKKPSSDLSRSYTSELINFYSYIHKYQEAIKVQKNLIQKISDQSPVDTTALMWAQYDLFGLAILKNPEVRISDLVDDMLDYCEKHNNKTLKSHVLARYRHYLINNHMLKDFHKYFADHYKSLNVDSLKGVQRVNTCLGNAFLCEEENGIEQAHIYYKMAISAALKEDNRHRLANCYRRHGQFFLRQGDLVQAEETFKNALAVAEKINDTKYTLEISDQLESLATKNKDFEAAYHYNLLKDKMKAQISSEQNEEDLLLMELENQRLQNADMEHLRELEVKRKHNIEYFAIGVGLILLFLLFVIISSMKVPNWLIQMLGFFSILFVFEFVILILDHKIHHWAHGAPVKIFLVKIAILSILFPLHHVAEHGITTYMVKHQLIKRPKKSAFRNFINKLYPWMDNNKKAEHI